MENVLDNVNMTITEPFLNRPENGHTFTFEANKCKLCYEVVLNPGSKYPYYSLSFESGALYKNVFRTISMEDFELMRTEESAKKIAMNILNREKNLSLGDWASKSNEILNGAYNKALNESKNNGIDDIINTSANLSTVSKLIADYTKNILTGVPGLTTKDEIIEMLKQIPDEYVSELFESKELVSAVKNAVEHEKQEMVI